MKIILRLTVSYLIASFLCRADVFHDHDYLWTPLQLAQTVVDSSTVTLQTGGGYAPSFDGTNVARGKFGGGGSALGMTTGVVLCTGHIYDLNGGPYNIYAGRSSDWGLPGSSLLETVLGHASGSTQDAATLTFYFSTTYNNISFRFAFSSEEYPQYVGSKDDGMAIVVDNPNVNNDDVNVALLPSSQTSDYEIRVGNVNDSVNSSYYRANHYGTPPPTLDFEQNGIVKSITSSMAVTPNTVYRVRIVVADHDDGIYDSAAYIYTAGLKGFN